MHSLFFNPIQTEFVPQRVSAAAREALELKASEYVARCAPRAGKGIILIYLLVLGCVQRQWV